MLEIFANGRQNIGNSSFYLTSPCSNVAALPKRNSTQKQKSDQGKKHHKKTELLLRDHECLERTQAKKELSSAASVPSINYRNGPSEAYSGENSILLRQVLNIECRGHYGKPCGCTPLGFQLVIGWWLSGYFQVLSGYCLRGEKTAVLRERPAVGSFIADFFLSLDFVDA